MEEDIKQIKSSLQELETERDDIQLRCIKAELELSIENLLQAYKQDEKVIKEAREFIENKMEYLKKCRTFKVVFYDEENMKHEWNEHLLYKENELLKILKGN